ncbi:hypothetical protein F5X99DRAFT_307101 [Biscogniauxia marginata]|nr:hypothetical protein F5X99DRAFT_307101 [Biscogniauxia marginata]
MDSDKDSSIGGVSIAPPPRATHHLVCEFIGYDSCEKAFELDKKNAWIEHVVTHLRGHFPKRCVCWFCDDYEFFADSTRLEDLKLNFKNRMHHIAEHFAKGAIVDEIRPDYFFLDHLDSFGLITKTNYQMVRNWQEGPFVRGIYPPSYVPPQTVFHQERRHWIVHDTVKEERLLRRRGQNPRLSREKGSQTGPIDLQNAVEYIARIFKQQLGSVREEAVRILVQSTTNRKSIDTQLSLVLDEFVKDIRNIATVPIQHSVASFIEQNSSNIAIGILAQVQLEPTSLLKPGGPQHHHSRLIQDITETLELLVPKDTISGLNNRIDKVIAQAPIIDTSLDTTIFAGRERQKQSNDTSEQNSNIQAPAGIYKIYLKLARNMIGALIDNMSMILSYRPPPWDSACDLEMSVREEATYRRRRKTGAAGCVICTRGGRVTRFGPCVIELL